jgi:hypothetical protein
MGTNCAPVLTDLFLYSYESEFLQKLVKDKKIHQARAFNFTYRYIDDVLSISNSTFVYENASLIIFSADTEYISTRSWYRNINFLRDRIRRICL